MDHVESMLCSQPPHPPTNVGAYTISDKRIAVLWDKPLGDGYMYKVTVDEAGQNLQSKSGKQGFGNVGFQEIDNLTADKNYTVNVELECQYHQGAFSQKVTTFVTTLSAGK